MLAFWPIIRAPDRSLVRSKGKFGTIHGAMVCAEELARMVWPSASDRTTAPMPSVPPAPPRFSTMIGWPSAALSGSNKARGTMSVALPAAKGMKARMGLDGQVWAIAGPEFRPMAAARSTQYQDFMSCTFVEILQNNKNVGPSAFRQAEIT